MPGHLWAFSWYNCKPCKWNGVLISAEMHNKHYLLVCSDCCFLPVSANRSLPKWPWQLFRALPVESQWFQQYVCTPNSLHFLKLPNKFKWGTHQMYPSKRPEILAPNHCRLIALIAAERQLCFVRVRTNFMAPWLGLPRIGENVKVIFSFNAFIVSL